jgi:hypothetical protein
MTVASHEPRDTRTRPGILRWAQHDVGHQGARRQAQGAQAGVPL